MMRSVFQSLTIYLLECEAQVFLTFGKYISGMENGNELEKILILGVLW